jgi:hypothetical protein
MCKIFSFLAGFGKNPDGSLSVVIPAKAGIHYWANILLEYQILIWHQHRFPLSRE